LRAVLRRLKRCVKARAARNPARFFIHAPRFQAGSAPTLLPDFAEVSPPLRLERHPEGVLLLRDASDKHVFQGTPEAGERSFFVAVVEEAGGAPGAPAALSVLPVTGWVNFHRLPPGQLGAAARVPEHEAEEMEILEERRRAEGSLLARRLLGAEAGGGGGSGGVAAGPAASGYRGAFLREFNAARAGKKGGGGGGGAGDGGGAGFDGRALDIEDRYAEFGQEGEEADGNWGKLEAFGAAEEDGVGADFGEHNMLYGDEGEEQARMKEAGDDIGDAFAVGEDFEAGTGLIAAAVAGFGQEGGDEGDEDEEEEEEEGGGGEEGEGDGGARAGGKRGAAEGAEGGAAPPPKRGRLGDVDAARDPVAQLRSELESFLRAQGGLATSTSISKNFRHWFKQDPNLKERFFELLRTMSKKEQHLDGRVTFSLKQ
jgi:hypothetical protein